VELGDSPRLMTGTIIARLAACLSPLVEVVVPDVDRCPAIESGLFAETALVGAAAGRESTAPMEGNDDGEQTDACDVSRVGAGMVSASLWRD